MKVDVRKLVFILSLFAVVLAGALLGGESGLMLAGGVVVAFCALMNYDWFFAGSRAGPLVALLGREGARVAYVAIGALLFFAGLLSV